MPSERRRLLLREQAALADAAATARENPSERRRLRGVPSRLPEDAPRDYAAQKRTSAPQLPPAKPSTRGSHARTAIIAATIAAAATAGIVIYVTRRGPDRERPAPTRVERAEPKDEGPIGARVGKALEGVDKSRQWEDVVNRGNFTSAPTAPKPGEPTTDTGQLTIASTPNATIWIDGKKLGDTPITHNLAPGTHELKAVLADGRSRIMPIHISSGELTDAGTLRW